MKLKRIVTMGITALMAASAMSVSAFAAEDENINFYNSVQDVYKRQELADHIYGAGKTPTLTGFSQPARVTITNGEEMCIRDSTLSDCSYRHNR